MTRSAIMSIALPSDSRHCVAGAGSTPDGPMMDRTVDGPTRADGFLRVEWSVGATEPGQSRIVGYVYNDYREDAVNVQLRISLLDAAGRPGASVVQPVGDTVRAGGRAFFDLRIAPFRCELPATRPLPGWSIGDRWGCLR